MAHTRSDAETAFTLAQTTRKKGRTYRYLVDETKFNAPFQEVLVWKFSGFNIRPERAGAFCSMSRGRSIKVISITEHDNNYPIGKLLEAIIGSVEEFHQENPAQVARRSL